MSKEEKTEFEQIAEKIGKLVGEKNKAYGNSFAKSNKFLELLWPHGVPVDQYQDMLIIVRVFDKLMRIATDKDAFGEDPFADILGYSILAVYERGKERAEKLEQ